jgi:cobalt/nickel transport system permease protein
LHHLVVEGWSRQLSPLHSRDPRAKLLVALVFLVAVSTTPVSSFTRFYGYALLLAAAIGIARLPLGALLLRVLVILPFVATFTMLTWLAGQPERALGIAEKSFFSTIIALILVATTPMNDLLRGLESLAAPRPLVLTIQFLYRYLFVISEQAQHMRMAARARGSRFQSAAGAVSVLFARSWERADGIYRAMLARGFNGRFSTLNRLSFGAADAAFLCITAGVVIGIRIAL